MAANNIKDAAKLPLGAKLLIPSSDVPIVDAESTAYTVLKGDTLYGISRKFGVSLESIQRANKLSGTTIVPGQVLSIPGKTSVVAVVPQASQSTADKTETTSSPAKSPAADAGKQTVSSVPTSAPLTVKAPAWPIAGTVSYLQGKLKGATIKGQAGTALVAVRAGTVISAGPFRGFGRVAFVQAADSLVYVYGGADSLNVAVGDNIRRGTTIGLLDSAEDSLAYFFVFKGQDAIDPVSAPRD